MWKFSIFMLLVSVLNRIGDSAKLIDCDCEDNKSPITIRTIDDLSIDRISNELEKITVRNEIVYYRLQMLGERFEEHEKLLKNLSGKALEIDEKIENQIIPDISVRTILENEQQESNQRPKSRKFPQNCAQATAVRHQSGLYTIKIDFYRDKPFLVFCNDETQGGGWTVVQRRKDGSTDFYRDWAAYKIGFGNLYGEFFIGLDKLHALTTDEPQELLIVMTDFDNITKYAKYDAFAIGDEEEFYSLKALGTYSGDAGDSLSGHVGNKFTTKDKKNDVHSRNCAVEFTGAWWYDKCHLSNLNGRYLKGSYNQDQFAQGVVWKSWHEFNYSLKTVEILIRPKRS